MSLRKLAGLAAGFALAVGLIGTGVSAQWSKSVTAQENINVGSFGCAIVDWTGAVSPTPQQSVSFTALPIVNSIPGQAAFSFTVKNTGTVPQNLTISSSGISSPFVDLLGTPAAVPLNGSDTHTYNGGVSWPDLTNYTGGLSASITYTVNCTEKPALVITGNAVTQHPGYVLYTASGVGFKPNTQIELTYDVTAPVLDGNEGSLDSEYTMTSTDGTGVFTWDSESHQTGGYYGDNCVFNTGSGDVLQHTDFPFTMTASDGTTTVSASGILKCSLV